MSRWSRPPTSRNTSGQSAALKKPVDVRDYFDDDEDEEYHSSSVTQTAGDGGPDDEEDPLDQFMAGVDSQVHLQQQVPCQDEASRPEVVSEQDRDYEGYFDMVDRQSRSGADAADVDYDSDGAPVGVKKADEKKPIDPLPPVDHATINYPAFCKNLYSVHAETAALSELDVAELRERLDIHVMGNNVPKPVVGFNQTGFNAQLLREVARQGYEAPTAIQTQALPVALSGRDIIGLAKTGSGKTLSFVWPMIVHVLAQPQMQLGDGPIGLILSPTRELATQIYTEANKFCRIFNIRVCAVYGGEGKWEQARSLKEAPEIVVATPGRFIDFASSKATNLRRCTMIVLDEADRMFEMGFEYQMRSIVNNIRPDRQTLLFSATMKKKIEGFAREILRDPVRIVIGSIGASNKDIKQVVDVVPSSTHKWQWLITRIDDWVAEGKVLIFVGSKSDTEALAKSLKDFFNQRQLDIGVDCLHGDKTQADRSNILRKFRAGEVISVLVATDVASRGLDVKDIRTVVNYDCAKNIETHVHRIGRTGRMGVDGVTPGTAYTILVSEKVPSADSALAFDLVKNLRDAEQDTPALLLKLAESDQRWDDSRGHFSKGSQSRFSGRRDDNARAGIGSSGAAVAMTSAMLAGSETKHESSRAVLPTQDFGANKYIVGHSMGRGKHLTQPAWMADTDLERVESGTNVRIERTSSGSDPYVNMSSKDTDCLDESKALAAATVPALPGFVRAAASLSSVSPSTLSELAANGTDSAARKKRSRWDT